MIIKEALRKYGQDQATLVLAYLYDCNLAWVRANQEEKISEEMEQKLETIFSKVKQGLPIQYALGIWDFYGNSFKITPDVLIPRPETENLVDQLLSLAKDQDHLLDIGTGSGAIAISLKLARPDLEIEALDISAKALDIAKENALNLGAKLSFIQSDLFEKIDKKYDIIVSNPPYISQKDYDRLDPLLYKEPKLALLAGDKGTEIYEKIIKEAKDYLVDDGYLVFEIGYDQASDLKDLLTRQGYSEIKVIKDYAGHDRIIQARLKSYQSMRLNN